MKASTTRSWLRWTHIALSAILGTFLYSPWGAEPGFRLFVQAAVFPLVGLSGVLMWQQAKLRKLVRGMGRGDDGPARAA